MKFKASVEALLKSSIVACHDLEATFNKVDFESASNSSSKDMPGYLVADGIATIKIRGLLVPDTPEDYSDYGVTGYNYIREYIEQANSDDNVTDIILDIDSGGGFTTGVEQTAVVINSSEKKITTFASGDMYSAAYWLGSSANKVTASSGSGIGSIGVYATHVDESQAIENEGLKVSVFKSGFWKAAFSSYKPLSEREEERLQEEVNEQADQFFNHVADNRNLKFSKIKALDGDSFNAKDALEIGLIDEISNDSINQKTTQSNHNPQPTGGTDMDLKQALAENEDLKAKLAKSEAKLAQAEKDKAKAESEQRQTEIDTLAKDTGAEFTDEDKTQFAKMDADAFAFSASQLRKAHANQKPKPNTNLFGRVADDGVEPENDHATAVLANIKGAKNA